MGESYIEDVAGAQVAELVAAGRLTAGTDFAAVADYDAIVICVPTPLSANREPDLSILESATRAIAPYLRAGHLVVVESTTYPGTTREVLRPILEAGGLVAGRDFNLAMSPERIDPGRTDFTVQTTPKIVGGLTPGLRRARAGTVRRLHRDAGAGLVLRRRRADQAAREHLSQRQHRPRQRAGDALRADGSRRLGGCRRRRHQAVWVHAVLPRARAWAGTACPSTRSTCHGAHASTTSQTEFIELAGKVNQQMPYHCAERVTQALNGHRKPVAGSNVLVLGVSYKSDVGDLRESPALRLIELLHASGAEISYHDPHVPSLRTGGLELQSQELTDEVLENADIVCVVTAHRAVDHERVARLAPLVMDFRNVVPRTGDKVVTL